MNLLKVIWLITVFVPAAELTIQEFGVMQFPPRLVRDSED